MTQRTKRSGGPCLPTATKEGKKERKLIMEEIELPEGVSAGVDSNLVKIKGPKGAIERRFLHSNVRIHLDGMKLRLDAKKNTKREKKVIGSFKAHIKNMINGVLEPHYYTMKICSGHFPMTVSVVKNELVIKNFFGERTPRKIALSPNVKVNVDGEILRIESVDKELAGHTAGSIEELCKRNRKSFDKRIFQDGIYITNKDGKEIR